MPSDKPTAADMAAFGASDEACYRWPEDTPEHKALRAAFIAGAAAEAMRGKEPMPWDTRTIISDDDLTE
jgi:hypothetical protein